MSKAHLFEVLPETTANATVDTSDASSISTSDDESVDSNSASSGPVRLATRQKKDYRAPSTFHLKPVSEMSFNERLLFKVGMMDESYYYVVDEHVDLGPIPTHPQLPEHFFILSHALVAPILQHLSYILFPNFKWPIALAYPIYIINYGIFMIKCLKRFRFFASKYGTLNQRERGRDRVPDAAIDQIARGFLAYLVVRLAGEFALKYNKNEMPLHSFSLWTPVKFFVWLCVMDYFFYVYHRSSHEIDSLWSIHQTHHTTRTPNPVLSILAGEYQEVIEIGLVPLAATLLVPMSFHELWLLVCYTGFVEVLGHTGIRAYWDLPICGPVLKLIGCNLALEDHDLHHRYGKSGRNYGKQTRLWDKVFGTCDERIELYGF